MCRWKLLTVSITALAVQAARADDPDLIKATALQSVMQRVIGKAEPSIACILVSRSEAYNDLDPGSYDKSKPGKLGIFDADVLKRVLSDKKTYYLKLLDLANTNYVPQAFGSGVVIDASGLVLTNYHVVQEATKLYVRLPGGKGSYADIHAADPRSDLAVLRLLNPQVQPLTPIALGDADKLERGQFILTLANPYAAGFRDGQPSASWGILSNMRRRSSQNVREEEFIKPLSYCSTLLQTDARLNLGCSGGALLNLQGEMVGLLTSLAAVQGGENPGGFALPISAGMRRIINVLRRGEEVEYGFLGINFDERVPSAQAGITIKNVGKGSPADRRLEPYDVILAVNGQPMLDTDEIYTMVGTQLAGNKIKLTVRRGSNERVVDVTLAKLYVPGKRIVSSLGNRPFFRGLRVDYTSTLVHPGLGPDVIPAGVCVSDVQSSSTADRVNLKIGDIITQVNQRPVNNPSAFYQAVANAVGSVELTLQDTSHVRLK